MTVRMRHTKAHTGKRRSHHALSASTFSKCEHCSAEHLRHRACPACGFYRGREVVDVRAKIEKAQKKEKEKKAQTAGGESSEKQ